MNTSIREHLVKLVQATSATHLRRNITMTIGRQLAAGAAQLAFVIVIARALGPEGNGFYAIATLLPSLLVNFTNLGVGSATAYFVGRGDVSAYQAAQENIRLGILISIIGVAIAVPTVSAFHSALFPGVPIEILLLGITAFPVTILLTYLNSILQGLEDFRAFNTSVLLPPLLTLSITTILIYAPNLGASAAVAAFTLGQLAGVTASLIFLKKHRINKTPQQDSYATGYRRRILSYGWKAHLSSILSFINYRADIYLVNFYINPATTGLYVIAVQIAERLWIVSQAFSTVLFPRLSAMNNTPDARLTLAKKSFIVVSGMTVVLSIFSAAIVYWLTKPIFGEQFEDVIPVFMWLLPGIVASAGARVLSNCIAASGKPGWNTAVAAGVVTLNITGNLFLIPKYGIIGAAWATSGAYSLNAAIKFFLVNFTKNTDKNPT